MTLEGRVSIHIRGKEAAPEGDAAGSVCRERHFFAADPGRDPQHGAAGFAVVIHKKPVIQNAAADDLVLRQFTEQLQVQYVCDGSGRIHFTGADQLIIQAVDDDPGTGQVFLRYNLGGPFRIPDADIVRRDDQDRLVDAGVQRVP